MSGRIVALAAVVLALTGAGTAAASRTANGPTVVRTSLKALDDGTLKVAFALRGAPTAGISWNFGDPKSGAANVSAAAAPFHIYRRGHTYTVTVRTGGMRTTYRLRI